jgi:hypothetical protein
VCVLVRAITADEYDATAAACPESCPLVAMGDRRTGQQLLHDAPADSAVSLRQFFRYLHQDPAREAAFLRRLAELPFQFELRDPFLDHVLATNSHLGATPVTTIEPPLPAPSKILTTADAALPAPKVFNADWALSPLLRRCWSFGYRAEDLVAVFDAVPPVLRALLCRATAAAQHLDRLRQYPLQHVAAILAAQAADSPAGLDESTFPGAADLGVAVDSELWEGELQVGFLTARYDGATQRRLSVAVNARLASLCGLHREELAARFAARDVPLPLLELDYLAMLAHELGAGASEWHSRYVRMGVGAEDGAREPKGLLMHMVTIKHFDALGRIVQVRCLIVLEWGRGALDSSHGMV